MTGNAKKWLELVSTDPELQQKTKDLQKTEIIALAQTHGITLTQEDFAVPQDGELSDDELDAVAGGYSYRDYIEDYNRIHMPDNDMDMGYRFGYGPCMCSRTGTGTD